MPIVSQYTFQSAKEELIKRLGNRSDINARAGEWLNSAQLLIAKSLVGVPDLEDTISFTTIDGSSEYTLTDLAPAFTDLIGIQVVKNVDTGNKMIRFPWREYRALNQQASHAPMRWARRGHVMALDPQPDDEYEIQVDFRRRPTLDALELDSEWQEPLIKLAASYGWSALQQAEKAKALVAELPPSLQLMISQPMDQETWEAWHDEDLAFYPAHWDR